MKIHIYDGLHISAMQFKFFIDFFPYAVHASKYSGVTARTWYVIYICSIDQEVPI